MKFSGSVTLALTTGAALMASGAAAASGTLVRPPAANWSVEARCGPVSAQLHYSNSLTEDDGLRAELGEIEVASATGRTTVALSEAASLQAGDWSKGRSIDRVVPSCTDDGQISFHVHSTLGLRAGQAAPFTLLEQHTFITVSGDGRVSVEQGEVTELAIE